MHSGRDSVALHGAGGECAVGRLEPLAGASENRNCVAAPLGAS